MQLKQKNTVLKKCGKNLKNFGTLACQDSKLINMNKNLENQQAVWAIFFAIGLIVAISAKRGFWIGFLIVIAAGAVGAGTGALIFPSTDENSDEIIEEEETITEP